MTEILKIFKTNIFIAGKFHLMRLEWYTPNDTNCSSEKLLRAPSNPKTFKNLYIKSAFLLGTLVLVFLQTLAAESDPSKENTDKFLAWLTIVGLVPYNCYLYFLIMKAPQIAAFINSLIKFDLHNRKTPKRIRERSYPEILRICMTYLISYVSTIAVPFFFVFGLHWSNPWKPSLAGYWLILKSGDLNILCKTFVLATGSKLIIFVVNYAAWGIGTECTSFAVGVIHNLSSVILLDNLHGFESKHLEHPKNLHKRALAFRQIQLLTRMLNELQEGPLIYVIITAAITVPAFAVPTLVTNKNMNIVFFMTLLYMAIACILVIIIIIGGMSTVYNASSKLLQKLKSHIFLLEGAERELERSFFRSCGPLKVMISSTNFVDELTPLHMVHFSMSLSVNILLLKD